jgi:hypothetical protein
MDALIQRLGGQQPGFGQPGMGQQPGFGQPPMGQQPGGGGRPQSRYQEWVDAGRPGTEGMFYAAVPGQSLIDGTHFGYAGEARIYDDWLRSQQPGGQQPGFGQPGRAQPTQPPSQGTPYQPGQQAPSQEEEIAWRVRDRIQLGTELQKQNPESLARAGNYHVPMANLTPQERRMRELHEEILALQGKENISARVVQETQARAQQTEAAREAERRRLANEAADRRYQQMFGHSRTPGFLPNSNIRVGISPQEIAQWEAENLQYKEQHRREMAEQRNSSPPTQTQQTPRTVRAMPDGSFTGVGNQADRANSINTGAGVNFTRQELDNSNWGGGPGKRPVYVQDPKKPGRGITLHPGQPGYTQAAAGNMSGAWNASAPLRLK